MKKLFFLFLLAFATFSLRAEGILGIGYQVGVTHLGNINRLVYTYNYTRPWLSQEMPFFKYAKGYQISFAFLSKNWGLEAGVSTLVETNEAYGIETATGLEAHRQIHVAQIAYSYGFRRVLKQTDHTEFGFTLSIDRNRLTAWTSYTNGQDEDFMRCLLEKTWGNTLRLNFSWFPAKPIGLSLRPFINLPWGHVNTEGLMWYITGDYNTQRGYAWNYGCTACLTFRFGHDKY